MDNIKEMGWTRVEKKDPTTTISESDLKAVFKLVDINKNGTICKIVSCIFCKMLKLKHHAVHSIYNRVD